MKKRKKTTTTKKKTAKASDKDREICELKKRINNLCEANDILGEQLKTLDCKFEFDYTQNKAESSKPKDAHLSEETEKAENIGLSKETESLFLAISKETETQKLKEELNALRHMPKDAALSKLIWMKESAYFTLMDELRTLRYERALLRTREKPRKQIEEVMGMAAAKIAKDVDANCVISIERKGMEVDDRNHFDVQVSIFRKLEGGIVRGKNFEKIEYLTKMRKVANRSMIPIKELLMEAISHQYISKGDRIVCVEDESVGTGYKGLIFIFDVDDNFFSMSMLCSETACSEVIEAVMSIALEIAEESKGKIGTSFIIGDYDKIKPHISQMILNPFSCSPYPPNVTAPKNRETVKNFAMLDGVFVIDRHGGIMNAGAYINVDAKNMHLPGEYGTRHRNSAALTKITDCIAVVVSESSGEISVFKEGKLVTKLYGKKSKFKGDINEIFKTKNKRKKSGKKIKSNKRSSGRHSRHHSGHEKRRKSRHTKR